MKNKKTVLAFSAGIVVLIIILIRWGLPRNMGPVEPFLNLGDLVRGGGKELPGKPAYYQIAPDCTTGNLVHPGELIQPDFGCDFWGINRFERPFNARSQDEYYPDLDIQTAFLGRDESWYYLRITLFEAQPGTQYLAGTYALEMDFDLDGRGDLLVLVSEPGKESGRKWSTQGVQVWADTNNDVGGEKPSLPEGSVAGDGYDQMLFGQGEGDDPDSAWARVFLTNSASLELAFKTEYLDGETAFKWWVWSGYDAYSPDSFELHDHYSQEQAGSVYQGLEYFPINQLDSLDSSCANMWGASPDPDDPDYCFGEVQAPDNNSLVGLKCIMPFFPFNIPSDKPGDDPCVLPFQDWLVLIWKPTQPGQDPSDGQLWNEYGVYLKNPFCPPEGLVTPSFTPTPTYTPTPTVTPSPTPTDTPTPRGPICNNNCGCEPDLGETKKNCPQDCPQHCGNGVCDCAETSETCEKDCPKPTVCSCGDGVCNCLENRRTCPLDCN